jgi:hypothetical protein
MMGPAGLWWFEKNNIPFELIQMESTIIKPGEQFFYKKYEPWFGGRIDCYGGDWHYPEELGLPIMDGESYGRFSDWLDNFKSEELVTEEYLFETFEKETGHKIRFWKEGMYDAK